SPKYVKDEKHRITKIGKVIRPIRLDEIPQFYDILRGKMSFVGPRPEQPKFVEELSEQLSYYNLRHKVKPGLTGWAQINYKYASTIQEQSTKLSYDLYYVKNRSLYLDLQIILKTIETVVFRKGAE
ncbi:MAG: sugar transferase, partial [Minisyncoccia bacterium]